MQRIIINTNVATQEHYDENGFSIRGGSPRIVANSEFMLTWNLYSATPGANRDGADVSTWTRHTGYAGCTARLGCDDDWMHRVSGTYAGEAITAGGTVPSTLTVTINGATDQNLSFSGLVTLYNASGEYETFLYTSRTISGNTVSFNVGSGLTAEHSYSNGNTATCSQELFFQASADPQLSNPGNGIFVFRVRSTSTKLKKIIDTINGEVIGIQGLELLPFSVDGTTVTQYPSLFLDTPILVTTMQEVGTPDQIPDSMIDPIGEEVAVLLQSGISQEIWDPVSSSWSVYSGGSGEWKGRYWLTGGGSGASKTEFPLIQGPQGNMPTISAGSTTELLPGSSPVVDVVSSGSAYYLNVGLPSGREGTLAELSAFSASSGYSRLSCVTYEGGGYQVIADTAAGETPASNPEKFVCFARPGQLQGAAADVTYLTSGRIVFPDTGPIPIALLTAAGNVYPVEKSSLDLVSGAWRIDPAPYLAYDNVSSFSGTWTVYFAGGGAKGEKGDMPVLSAGSASMVPTGSAPSVAVISSGSAYYLDLGLPQGEKGDPPVLSAGSAFALPTGSASASVVSTGEGAYRLDFGLPTGSRGEKGETGNLHTAKRMISSGDVTASGTVVFPGEQSILTLIAPGGNSYPVRDEDVRVTSSGTELDLTRYLIGENSSAVAGSDVWTVMLAEAAVPSVVDGGTVSNSYQADYTSGDVQKITLSGYNSDISLTVSNIPLGKMLVLHVNNAAGANLIFRNNDLLVSSDTGKYLIGLANVTGSAFVYGTPVREIG